MKIQVSLKVFLTLTLTSIVSIITFFIIHYYTEIIKRDVYTTADRTVKELFQKDRQTYIRLIQLGSYLELSQQLQLNFQNEDLIKKIEIKRDNEALATYQKYGDLDSKKLSHQSFPLTEHGQNWGSLDATLDLTRFKKETEDRIRDLYITGFLIMLVTTVLALIVAAFISNELKKISLTITEKFDSLADINSMEALEAKMTFRRTNPSIVKEISFINKLLSDFIDLIRKTNIRIHSLENEARISRIAQDLAHDLHSPLAALDSIADSTEGESSEVVRLTSSRLKEIIKDLDKYRVEESHTLIEVKDVIHKSLILKQKEFPGLRIDTSKLIPVKVLFNEQKFQRIISNFINNSHEAGASTVSIGIQCVENKCVISFNDDGRGIPSHLLNSVLDRGFTFGKVNGSGIGLTQANLEVRKANGEIKIASEENVGTVIKIILPYF